MNDFQTLLPRPSRQKVVAWMLSLIAVVVAVSDAAAQGVPRLPGLRPSSDEQIPAGDRLVRARVAPRTIVVPAGQRVLAAVVLEIDPGWHVYWRNPGDSGVPPSLKWSLPAGVVAGPIRWPRPQVFQSPVETTIGYERQVGLVIPIEAAADAVPGRHRVELEASWMVCKDLCFMGRGTVAVELEVTPAPPAQREGSSVDADDDLPPADPELRRLVERIPRPLPPDSQITVRFEPTSAEEGTLILSGPSRFERIGFLPDAELGTELHGGLPLEVKASEGRFRLEVPVSLRPADVRGEAFTLAGVLVFGENREDPAFEVSVPVGKTSQQGPP